MTVTPCQEHQWVVAHDAQGRPYKHSRCEPCGRPAVAAWIWPTGQRLALCAEHDRLAARHECPEPGNREKCGVRRKVVCP